jgi:hypothetical protein
MDTEQLGSLGIEIPEFKDVTQEQFATLVQNLDTEQLGSLGVEIPTIKDITQDQYTTLVQHMDTEQLGTLGVEIPKWEDVTQEQFITLTQHLDTEQLGSLGLFRTAPVEGGNLPITNEKIVADHEENLQKTNELKGKYDKQAKSIEFSENKTNVLSEQKGILDFYRFGDLTKKQKSKVMDKGSDLTSLHYELRQQLTGGVNQREQIKDYTNKRAGISYRGDKYINKLQSKADKLKDSSEYSSGDQDAVKAVDDLMSQITKAKDDQKTGIRQRMEGIENDRNFVIANAIYELDDWGLDYTNVEEAIQDNIQNTNAKIAEASNTASQIEKLRVDDQVFYKAQLKSNMESVPDYAWSKKEFEQAGLEVPKNNQDANKIMSEAGLLTKTPQIGGMESFDMSVFDPFVTALGATFSGLGESLFGKDLFGSLASQIRDATMQSKEPGITAEDTLKSTVEAYRADEDHLANLREQLSVVNQMEKKEKESVENKKKKSDLESQITAVMKQQEGRKERIGSLAKQVAEEKKKSAAEKTKPKREPATGERREQLIAQIEKEKNRHSALVKKSRDATSGGPRYGQLTKRKLAKPIKESEDKILRMEDELKGESKYDIKKEKEKLSKLQKKHKSVSKVANKYKEDPDDYMVKKQKEIEEQMRSTRANIDRMMGKAPKVKVEASDVNVNLPGSEQEKAAAGDIKGNKAASDARAAAMGTDEIKGVDKNAMSRKGSSSAHNIAAAYHRDKEKIADEEKQYSKTQKSIMEAKKADPDADVSSLEESLGVLGDS